MRPEEKIKNTNPAPNAYELAAAAELLETQLQYTFDLRNTTYLLADFILMHADGEGQYDAAAAPDAAAAVPLNSSKRITNRPGKSADRDTKKKRGSCGSLLSRFPYSTLLASVCCAVGGSLFAAENHTLEYQAIKL